MLSAIAVILVGGSGMAVAAEEDPAPIAVVEPSGVVNVESGGSIVLDASTSTSTNDGDLTFAWYHDEAEDKGATGETYEVKDPDGIRTVQVKVTDSTGASAMSDPIVLVFGTPETQEAAISASTEEPLKIGETGTWSLKGSQGLYPSTKYTWYVDGGYISSGVAADGKDFLYAPIFPGKHRVTLLLRNALGQRSYTSSEFEATNGAEPIAVILPEGDPLTITKGKSITFDGSTSTGDGTPIYAWSSNVEDAKGSSASKYTVEFPKPGTYRIGLRVTDRSKRSAYATKTIKVVGDGPPVAKITPRDQTVPVGTTIKFDSSESKDPDGDLVGRWWFSSGVSGVASTDTVYERKFEIGGTYRITLQVKDEEGNSATDVVTITVTDKPPVANFTPGTDQTVPVGTYIKFDGSGSTDPENSPLRYSWFTTLITGEVSKTNSYARRFTSPGKFRVRMFVYDKSNNRSEKVVEITVKDDAPVVDFTPGANQTVTAGTLVTFNGSKSYDPNNGGELRYRWYTTGIPGVVSKTDSYARRFDKAGKFRVKLLGYNSINKVTSKIVEITVT